MPSGWHVLPRQPLQPQRLPSCCRGSRLRWRDEPDWLERLEEEEEDGRQGCVWPGGRALPPLRPLLRRLVLRPPLLDPHLQARAAGGAGVHAPPPAGQPGALPEVSLRRRPRLPDAARTWPPPGGQIQGEGVAVRPRLPAQLTAVVGPQEVSGKNTASRVPEKLEQGRTQTRRRGGGLDSRSHLGPQNWS